MQVWCGDRYHHVPETPERFDKVVCVLGREAISHGKHYWEVIGCYNKTKITIFNEIEKLVLSKKFHAAFQNVSEK